MIIDKQLHVSNRRKADIVVDLRKHGFRAFPKNKSAKEAGETEDAAEDDDDEDEVKANGETLADFDYLLGMPIWSLTKEKIAKLREQAGDKENELKKLLEKTPKDMWNADLDLFLEGWEVRLFQTEFYSFIHLGLNSDYRKIVLNLKRKGRRTRKERK